MIPKSWRSMKFYFTTVYQEIWVGLALTAYAYYKISYGGVPQILTAFMQPQLSKTSIRLVDIIGPFGQAP
ncbi:chromosome 14 2 [Pitangus sulphuratus]|nr:chromosome 14 2 [Pitangus sulphuratus]